jgi:hypothetical protein
MWQAAQLALKILAPLAVSAAKAGQLKAMEKNITLSSRNDKIFFNAVLLFFTLSI